MTIPLGHPAFEHWLQWRRWGTLPRTGGVGDQPLSLITQMRAIDTVTGMYGKNGEPNFEQMTAVQRELHQWMEAA